MELLLPTITILVFLVLLRVAFHALGKWFHKTMEKLTKHNEVTLAIGVILWFLILGILATAVCGLWSFIASFLPH